MIYLVHDRWTNKIQIKRFEKKRNEVMVDTEFKAFGIVKWCDNL